MLQHVPSLPNMGCFCPLLLTKARKGQNMIHLIGDYYLCADKYQYILAKPVQRGAGRISMNGARYCVTLQEAVATAANLALREGVAIPTSADLRESGQIEQDADAIILLASDVAIKDHPERKYYFGLAKNKEGDTGDLLITFNKPIQRFEEYEW